MTIKLILSAILLGLGISLSACELTVGSRWYGQTAKDDRTISPSLYPNGVDQQRELKQRY